MNDIKQGSDEWFAARLGKATASKIADILATIKSGESASRRNYRVELVCERLTGVRGETYTNPHMIRGTELEPLARALYESKMNVFVDEIGFVDHPTIPMSGASPDGLVGNDGLIEIKAPTAANHLDTILSGSAPSKYISQMQWQMACTGRAWCDFVSFNAEMPSELQLFIKRVPRDDEFIASTEKAVSEFLAEVASTVETLKELQHGNTI
ncbi:phage_rel_nuc, putative phage-type endonuclease [uncultured Caudovirales phage]|uniref:Phage_rel_nuc, putative phage-type endonuclease n=1 Tax=uncultured Caudovirales phage TaxID=2100421 RepID=A0A6J5LJY9_9CAUD|nr:phage_rel_nuc, putative phage-type endonuclease [uncultured Caudovirales phage]CAB4242054.1 phage_rel_nuc, putative phage-type endonuclease [uncultured Caudovirales phage]